jgi:hypothetical protein
MRSRQVSAGSAGSKHNFFEKQKKDQKDLIHHIENPADPAETIPD